MFEATADHRLSNLADRMRRKETLTARTLVFYVDSEAQVHSECATAAGTIPATTSPAAVAVGTPVGSSASFWHTLADDGCDPTLGGCAHPRGLRREVRCLLEAHSTYTTPTTTVPAAKKARFDDTSRGTAAGIKALLR